MVWFWFLVAVALFVALVWYLSLTSRANKHNAAIFAALSGARALRGQTDAEKLAGAMIDNLAHLLSIDDYQNIVSTLCQKHGLQYQNDGYVITDEVRDELARRIGREFMSTQHYLDSSRASED